MNTMSVLAYAYVISGNIFYQQYNEIDGIHYEHKCRRHFVSHWIRQEDQGALGKLHSGLRDRIAGGPNNEFIYDCEAQGGVVAAKSYAGPCTAPQA